MINIRHLQRQTRRFEFADGVRDFQTALLILLMSIFGWVVWDLPNLWLPAARDFMRWQGQLFAGIVIFGLTFALVYLVSEGSLRLLNEVVRRRWLSRKVGLVTQKKWVVSRKTLFAAFTIMLLSLLVGSVIAVTVGDPWLVLRALYLGMGWEFALMYFMIGQELDIRRYRPVALVGAVLSVLIAFAPLSVGQISLAMGMLWAVLLAASGFYALRQMAALPESADDGA
jgi:hypothetical protein